MPNGTDLRATHAYGPWLRVTCPDRTLLRDAGRNGTMELVVRVWHFWDFRNR